MACGWRRARDQYRIVGVIDRFYNPYGWPIHEYVIFFPNKSNSQGGGAPFLVRTEPGKMAAVRQQIEKTLPDYSVAVNPSDCSRFGSSQICIA